MRIVFSYPDVAPLEVEDARLLGVLAPRTGTVLPLVPLIDQALEQPLGSNRVETYASPSTRVLVLVDDNTRQTPAWGILPPLFRRLVKAGCKRKNVRILMATGTHPSMTREDIEKKLGPRIPSEHQVDIHHWKSEGDLTEIGAMADGTPVRVNRLLQEADLVIGVGQIAPHRVMGYTGGSTIVQPGVSGPEITGHTHWLSALYPGREILGIAENPVRAEVERVAHMAGLRFIVNVVMDAQQRVAFAVAGDPVAAHRRGAEYAREIHGAPLPALADIVVVESFPADYDLWQASKGVYSAELAVREGGAVILISPCPYGVASEHPEVELLGYHRYAEVKAMVEDKRIKDLIAAAHLAHVGRVIRDKAHGIMVSAGIDPATQGHLGFEPARTPQHALEMALAITGPDARVAVIRQGSSVLPLPESNGKIPSKPA